MLIECNLLSGTFPYIKSNLIDLFRICIYSIAIVFNFIAFLPKLMAEFSPTKNRLHCTKCIQIKSIIVKRIIYYRCIIRNKCASKISRHDKRDDGRSK